MEKLPTFKQNCVFCGQVGRGLSDLCKTHCSYCCKCRVCKDCKSVSNGFSLDKNLCQACDYEKCKECCTKHKTCSECEVSFLDKSFCLLHENDDNVCSRCCKIHLTCGVCAKRSLEEKFCRHCTTCDSKKCRERVDGSCTHAPQLNVTLARYDGKTPRFKEGKYCDEAPSERFMAVELEIAGLENPKLGYKVNNAVRKWRGAIVHDGSIKDAANPFEINTAPASGSMFVEQIKDITDALAESKGYVNKTCGMHVHIDARDLGFLELKKLILLYSKLEPALFRIVAPSRRSGNRYSAPCAERLIPGIEASKGQDIRKQIMKNVYGNAYASIRDLKADKYNAARYSALNMHSWVFHGTIEARLHQGTTDYEKIMNWASLWGSIVDFAVENSAKDIACLRGSNPVDSLAALTLVAPSDTVREWIKDRTLALSKNVDESREV